MPTALLMLMLALAASCSSSKYDTGSSEDPVLALFPPVGGIGTTMDLRVDADRSTFSFESTTVDLGDGILVDTVQVYDGWTLGLRITIEPDAELGSRDLLVATDGARLELPDSFTVVEESFSIEPGSGYMGETIHVDITGRNTDWESGVTWPSFGDGVDILDFTLVSSTIAQADISIASDTWAGLRDVAMQTGTEAVFLYDGFLVDRVGIAAAFDPAEAAQGDTVTFTVTGRGTNFLDGVSELAFWQNGHEKSDIVVDTMTVLDATNLYGQMTLSNAAELGTRDVLISTGDEGVMISDAFDVIAGELDLSQVAVSLAFYVERGIDNSSGAISESVVAQVIFYIPLDPACGSSSMMDSPQPYDVNGLFEYPEAAEEEDCPTPTTVGAGEHVWLESDANVVTLDRFVESGSGLIYYYDPDATLDDYVFGQWYDLHTQGEEGGLGEYLLEDVQPTVPADFQLLSPQLWGDYTHTRSQDFEYTWTPAQTYPDAYFLTGIIGTIESTGNGGYLGCIPWDDGQHAYIASELVQLMEGPVYFFAESYIEGPDFGLPDSIYQTNPTESYVYLMGSMILE